MNKEKKIMTEDKLKLEKIKFKGNTFLFIDGAITTKDDFENGRVSYAHMGDNGVIKRYGETIGTREDVEFTGEMVEVSPKLTSGELMFKAISGMGGW